MSWRGKTAFAHGINGLIAETIGVPGQRESLPNGPIIVRAFGPFLAENPGKTAEISGMSVDHALPIAQSCPQDHGQATELGNGVLLTSSGRLAGVLSIAFFGLFFRFVCLGLFGWFAEVVVAVHHLADPVVDPFNGCFCGSCR